MNRNVCFFSLFLCLILQGCAGTSSSNNIPTPPAPPTPTPPVTATVKIAAPLNGVTVTGQPVTLSVNFGGGADPTQMIALLDGTDITSNFGAADANGNRTVKVSEPAINYGKNQLQIRYSTTTVNSSFTFDTAKPPGLGATDTPTISPLVPIKTRVVDATKDLSHASHWGIQVGGTTYSASDVQGTPSGGNCSPCNRGLQVLLLNRNTLAPNSNVTWDIETDQDLLLLSKFLDGAVNNGGTGLPGCAPIGCILAMQSLAYVPYNSCFVDSLCSSVYGGLPAMNTDLGALGATNALLVANPNTTGVAYSFIGNAGSGHHQGSSLTSKGSQFERLECSMPTSCDTLGWSSASTTASDPGSIGSISGALVRDNFNNFTFNQNAPLLHYTFGTTRTGSAPWTYTNVLSINGAAKGEAGYFTQTLSTDHNRGGFRMLILDSTNPISAPLLDQIYDINNIASMSNDIKTYSGERSLFFIAALGDVSHRDAGDVDLSYPALVADTPTWDGLVTALSILGASPITVKILGFSVPAFDNMNPNDATTWDDYILVGSPGANKGYPGASGVVPLVSAPSHGSESGYVITRHTLTKASNPTLVEGVLSLDNQGNYASLLQSQATGISSAQLTSLVSASLLPPTGPTGWPILTPAQQSAYSWISNALCCTDIRSNYVNLNADPDVWLSGMYKLDWPADMSATFSQADFDAMVAQLGAEFGYVSLVRNLQTNILSLYQSQQSNVALILQQADADVQSKIDATGTPPTQAKPTFWSELTADVFPTLGNLAGFASLAGPEGAAAGNALKVTLGLASMSINAATSRTNDANGNSQQMIASSNLQLGVSDLAQNEVDQYSNSLISLGNDFTRVVSDWGRLKAMGGPLSVGQLPWDPSASGLFLRAFNLSTRRKFYPRLLEATFDPSGNSGFFVTHAQFAGGKYYGSNSDYKPHGECEVEDFHSAQDSTDPTNYQGYNYTGTAWYPGVLQKTPPSGSNNAAFYKNFYYFDIWALGYAPTTDQTCPNPAINGRPLPTTFGMFDPLDPNNTNALGLWKASFFENFNGRLEFTNPSAYPNAP